MGLSGVNLPTVECGTCGKSISERTYKAVGCPFCDDDDT
jgi:uncharacterized CHY-type Zn-finger protein